ncbi:MULTISPECIES: hypothetical protein [unclassified Bradyrhizobium]|uniref:hypothetical protein n=1 Tax=unclassified Bradyrhizobium TaxID=2631580 RepID=UPI001FFC252F|nr:MULTISPECIES: hypothetical protein [unclassified Bradyrhizobium]MCK1691083.1 hypothetical protein [Bradyrhizobium sp. 145]MCK1293429.1 hypothetical protein [Bradyrhizobium sp. 30]MCK1304164.1 hypothetical protein [Bradyrhizobium sp. 45]MCK1315841.1 hypothetical protein [Bradyrhizobium sp. 23]MCK1504671.1 hypothetical protein [Bradyrhizobium sp. 18]
MADYTRNAVVHNEVVDPGVELIDKPFTMNELPLGFATYSAKACDISQAGAMPRAYLPKDPS